MKPNDILVMKYRDPQSPQTWVSIVAAIQRRLNTDQYLHAQFQLAEDRRSLRVYKDEVEREGYGVSAANLRDRGKHDADAGEQG